MRLALLAAALGVLVPAYDALSQTPAGQPGLEEVRRLYYRAVESKEAIPRGVAEVDRQRSTVRDPHAAATLAAYRGAFTLLRAKHGTWPPDRLRHTRAGLAVLDSVVADHPDHAEARYLRLMSCYYLPRILGRGWSVRDDFAALARLLPAVRTRYPPDLYDAIVRFVLENGDAAPEQRAALRASLHRGDG